MYTLHFAQPSLMFVCLLLTIVGACIRRLYHKPIVYIYPLVSSLRRYGYETHVPLYILNILRFCALCTLAILVGRPQWVDTTSKVRIEGLDIMLVLDVSGSMVCFDSLTDQRTRFDVAKQEAISFVKKRENDFIGLVIFGKDAVSRCPLTLDKNILSDIIRDLQLGDVDPEATALSIALSMAISRLKNSQAKSKIIILLTDGEPTKGLDIDHQIPIEMAQKLGIKIYTIGVGNPQGAYLNDPAFGVARVMIKLNTELLKTIAHQTGGQFFLAAQPHDLKRIYDTIDALEKTEREADIFTHYLPIIIPFLVIATMCLLAELLLSYFVWFGL
jgi:Ca-activated chloride channel family protein